MNGKICDAAAGCLACAAVTAVFAGAVTASEGGHPLTADAAPDWRLDWRENFHRAAPGTAPEASPGVSLSGT
jgi:hypothetical protein